MSPVCVSRQPSADTPFTSLGKFFACMTLGMLRKISNEVEQCRERGAVRMDNSELSKSIPKAYTGRASILAREKFYLNDFWGGIPGKDRFTGQFRIWIFYDSA